MANIPHLIQANQKRFDICKITPSKYHLVMQTAARLIRSVAKDQYLALERATGVPWFDIAVIHEREASQNFLCSIAQGDRWDRRSVNVPSGRGPFKSFFDAGVDALVNCAPHASRWNDWTAGGTLTLLEMYNGFGYEDYHHEASPYIWGATDQEEWGKYIRDGVYDAHAWDQQLGTAAMLKGMMELDSTIKFADAPTSVPEVEDISWIQDNLNKIMKPIPPIVVDGINGAKTFAAIKDFQKAHPPLDVDGIAGPNTIVAMKVAIGG